MTASACVRECACAALGLRETNRDVRAGASECGGVTACAFARVGISFKTVFKYQVVGDRSMQERDTHHRSHSDVRPLSSRSFHRREANKRRRWANARSRITSSQRTTPSPRHTSAGTERALRCQHATPNPAENTRPAAEARACGGATTALVWCSQVLPKGALLAVTAPARSCQRRAFA